MNNNVPENNQKKESRFVKFIKAVFVENIGLKIFALLFAIAVGVIIMGISPVL